MNKQQAYAVIKRRNKIKKEIEKITNNLWSAKLTLDEREKFRSKRALLENELKIIHPEFIAAFALFFMKGIRCD